MTLPKIIKNLSTANILSRLAPSTSVLQTKSFHSSSSSKSIDKVLLVGAGVGINSITLTGGVNVIEGLYKKDPMQILFGGVTAAAGQALTDVYSAAGESLHHGGGVLVGAAAITTGIRLFKEANNKSNNDETVAGLAFTLTGIGITGASIAGFKSS